ncbi:adenylate isopentenyltransferase 3, chloroplastic [Brachypodium distachyon]|nr:adenylate isopentenyltransferase 3, chloroplastic [Brachypodium distachyon]|eukprot:XP_003565777.1 adenylate isopentenyltransferase 3, chloroplastic [Brachypodium distachyon]
MERNGIASRKSGGKKNKVVFVMGATATGKSKLAVDLALQFGGEVINSDKIQLHDGLPIVTNKITPNEQSGVPHHLIGGLHPDSDYSPSDFRRDATRAVENVLSRGALPIVAGGSNRYLEALLDGPSSSFRRRFECCFVWVDAGGDVALLEEYVRQRVDAMVEQGLVEEVRGFFREDGDYSRGIRRAIGVPEMDAYFRMEAAGELIRAGVLEAAVEQIKRNTCVLARRQVGKIRRLSGLPGWNIRRVHVGRVLALKVAGEKRKEDAGAERELWEKDVLGPAARTVEVFLAKGAGERGGAGVGAAVEWYGRGLQFVEAASAVSPRFHGRKAAAAV